MNQKLLLIINEVSKKENYIPRNYQTIGGMWTVESYEKDDIKVQIMDEGWTRRLFTKTVDVYIRFRFNKDEIEFKKGSENDLNEILEKLNLIN